MSDNQFQESQPKPKNKVSKEFIQSLKNTAKLPNVPPQLPPQGQQYLFPMPTPEQAKKIVEEMKRRGQIPPPFLLPPNEAKLAIEQLKRRGIPYPPPPASFLQSAPKNRHEEKSQNQQQPKKQTSHEKDDILQQDINKIALEKKQSNRIQENQQHRNRIQSPDQIEGSTKKGDYRPRTQRSLIKSIYEDEYPNNRKGNISRNYIPRSPHLTAQKINKSYREIPRYRQEQLEQEPKIYKQVPRNQKNYREQDLVNQYHARYGQFPEKSGWINDQRDYLDSRDPRYVDYKNVSPQFYQDKSYNLQRHPKAPPHAASSKSNLYNPISKLQPQIQEGTKYKNLRGTEYSDYEMKLRRNYDNLYTRDYDRQQYYEKSPVMRLPQEDGPIKHKSKNSYYPTKNVQQQYYQQDQVPYTNLKDELRNITNMKNDQYTLQLKKPHNVSIPNDYGYRARGQHLGIKRNLPYDKLYDGGKGYYENRYADVGYDRKGGYLGDKSLKDVDYLNHRHLIQNNKRYL